MWTQITSYIPHALFGFLVTFFLVLGAFKVFPKIGLMDKPKLHGLKRKPIPYSGGILIAFTVLLGTILFLEPSRAIWSVIIGGVLITAVSFFDDRKGLSAFVRLGVQALAGIIVVFGGIGIRSITNPFGDPIVLDSLTWNVAGLEIWPLSAIFIIIWIMGMMNVMNWLDGLNGLSSGIGVVGAVVMFGLSIQQFHTVDQNTVSVMSILLAASALAFLIFEFYPARILMGDSGSMFLGFFLGVLAIFSGGKVATALLIMGFPVLDAAWVILRRLMQKKSPFKGDLRHFHHRLLYAGLSHRAALILNYSLAAAFGGIALFLGSAQQKLIALLVVGVLMLIFGLSVWVFEKKKYY